MSSPLVKRRRSSTCQISMNQGPSLQPAVPPSNQQPHTVPYNGSHAKSAPSKRQKLNEGISCRSQCSPYASQSLSGRPPYRLDLAHRGLVVRASLGSGSYSKVRLVQNITSSTKELLAVKIVDRQKAPNDYIQYFLPRELRLWAQLSHPNLVKMREAFEKNERVYMMLEYVDGGDVLTYIQTRGALNESTSKSWLNQICSAVKYMHDRNVSHRDLKLENLLLTNQSQTIKICDFGFVKEVANSEELSQTFCGSKAYAAPEILQGKPYDPKMGDIWALGVITYIFVTGKMPFDESRGTKRILEDQLALNLHFGSSSRVHPSCSSLILKMLTWAFNERPTISKIQKSEWLTS